MDSNKIEIQTFHGQTLADFCAATKLPIGKYGSQLMQIFNQINSFDDMWKIWCKVQENNDPNPANFFNHFDIKHPNGINHRTTTNKGVDTSANETKSPLSILTNFCNENGLSIISFPGLIHMFALFENDVRRLHAILADCPGGNLTDQILNAIQITQELTRYGQQSLNFDELTQKLEQIKAQDKLEQGYKKLIGSIIKFSPNSLINLSEKQEEAVARLKTILQNITLTEVAKQATHDTTTSQMSQSLVLSATLWDICVQKGNIAVTETNNAELKHLFWQAISNTSNFLQATDYRIADVLTLAADCPNVTALNTKFAKIIAERKKRDEMVLSGSKELPIVTHIPSHKPAIIAQETIRGNKNRLLETPSVQIYRLNSPEQNESRAGVLYMEIEANCKVISLPTDQSTQASRYEAGFHTANFSANSILLCTKQNEAPKAFVVVSVNNLIQIQEFVDGEQYLPNSPINLLLTEIIEQLMEYSEGERIQPPDFVLKLRNALKDLDNQHNIAPNLHLILDEIDSFQSLDRDKNGTLLKEKWKDLLTGIFNGGWAISTGGQRLIEKLHQNSASSNLPPNELQKYYDSIFSYESLLQLFAEWKQAGYLSAREHDFLNSECRYTVSGACIWSYCEAATTHVADSKIKEVVHKQLTDYCYKVKSETIKTISFEEFKSEAANIFSQFNQSLHEHALLWEYLYSEVCGNYTQSRNAYIDRIAHIISTDTEVTKSPAIRKLFRREADGKPVSTLRYSNKSKQLIVRYTEDELYEPNSPMRQFCHARIQSTGSTEELRLNISPDTNQILIDTLGVFSAKKSESEFSQSSLEASLLWYAITQKFSADPETDVELEGIDIDLILENLLTEMQNSLLLTVDQNSPLSASQDVISRIVYAMTSTHDQVSAASFKPSQVRDEIWVPMQNKLEFFEQKLFYGDGRKQTKEYLKKLLAHIFDTRMQMHPQLRQNLLELLQRNLGTENARLLASSATKAVIKTLYLKTEHVVTQIHGFGGGTESYDPLNEYVGKQDSLPNTVIHTLTDKNSNGHGVFKYKNKKIYVTRKNNQRLPNFCTLGAGLLQKYKQRATPAYKRHAQFGHSMGALEALEARMLASDEVRENIYTFAGMPVATDNETKVRWSEVLTNIMDYPELHDQIVISDQVAELLKERNILYNVGDSSTAVLKTLLLNLLTSDEDIFHHIPLLVYDSDMPKPSAIAGSITGMATHPALGDRPMQAALTLGNTFGLNSTLLYLLIKNVQPPVAGIHRRELSENPINFIAHCRQILLNAPTLTKEEVSLLENISSKNDLVIYLALNDVILKYQFFLALYPELVKYVVFAQNLGQNFKADHYALTDHLNVSNVTKMLRSKMI